MIKYTVNHKINAASLSADRVSSQGIKVKPEVAFQAKVCPACLDLWKIYINTTNNQSMSTDRQLFLLNDRD